MLRLPTVHTLACSMWMLAACGSGPAADDESDSGASVDASHPPVVDASATDGSAVDASATKDGEASDADTILDAAFDAADAQVDAVAPSDASAPVEAGGGHGVAHCGNIACTGQNSVCCAQYGGNTFGPTSCVASSCAGASGTTMLCAATADCDEGAVCCLTTMTHDVARCAQACAASDFGQLCDPKAAKSGCPSGEACVEEKDHLFIAIPEGQGLCQK